MQKILPNTNPTELNAWESLKKHFQNTKQTTLKEYFENEPNRLDYSILKWRDFYVDFSKNRLDKKGFDLLLQLAEESGLKKAIDAQFSGSKINVTEDRAVLHTALRSITKDPVLFEGENVLPSLANTQKKMYAFCDKVISGAWKGYTGKEITHIVNIGIGGSDLGPAMVVEALEYYKNQLDVRFVSNVEGDHHQEIIKDLNPETTLFVIVSKTFTTQETLSNANSLRTWFLNQAPKDAIAKHFVAVSTNTEKTAAFGIPILNHLIKDGNSGQGQRKIKALVVTPTRELAIQIAENFTAYSQFTNFRNTVIFGGVNQSAQTQALRRGVNILVATPGRLLDLMDQGYIKLKDIEYFVLDEADRMLDMGFIHDIRKIISKLPHNRQSLFFSATMPNNIVDLSKKILQNPIKVEVNPVSSTAETINQYLYYTNRLNKKDLLFHILRHHKINQVLLFSRTKHGADKIVRNLKKSF